MDCSESLRELGRRSADPSDSPLEKVGLSQLVSESRFHITIEYPRLKNKDTELWD